jgi:hypothetical protein
MGIKEKEQEFLEDDYVEEEIQQKKQKHTYKGKRKKAPQRIDPKNWEDCDEDDYADLTE